MESTAIYTEKAARYRLLAAAVDNDHASEMLSAMAEKLETLAATCAAREDGEKED